MIETILTTVLSSAILLKTPTASSASQSPQVAFTRVLPDNNFVGYTIKENDTLQSISVVYYGTSDYWTTLWNDNPWITDPSNLPIGKILNIRAQKPEKPSALTQKLSDENDALNQKEDEAYLQRIGYLSNANAPMPTNTPPQVVPTVAQATATPVPTIIVTATPVVTQAPVVSTSASTISDAAITYLGNCEAGMDPAKNTGNGYYGAFQFSYGTWKSLNTGYERADLAPIEVQEAAVKQLLQRSSIYNQFPACAVRMRGAGLI
jgi:transglycosylase-like protein